MASDAHDVDRPAANAAAARAIWSHPYVFIALLLAAATFGLLIPAVLPLGSNYWDLSLYLDAAHRIANGQMPSRDFLAPAGPLEYYMFYLANRLFPSAHPLLSTQWAMLPIAILLFLPVVDRAEHISRRTAMALALPFVVFAALPLNTGSIYPAPGFDGYGIYNRHPALLLYALTAALMFVKDGLRLQLLVGALLTCLFFIKITAFATGLMLVGYGVIAGRLGLWRTLANAGVCLLLLGVVELATGLVSAYGANLLQLASLNEGTFLSRLRNYAGNHLDVFAPSIFAAALLLLRMRPALSAAAPVASARTLLDSDGGWICAILAASFVFEIQNTGNLEFIYMWPVALVALRRLRGKTETDARIAVAVIAALCLPTAVNFLQRAAQTFAALPSYQRIDAAALGPLGRVSARPIYVSRADALSRHYSQNREAYRALAREGVEPSDILTAEPDFQAGWLRNAAQAVVALRAFEANTGRFIDSVYTLDFTDPFAFALGKTPIRHVPIGVDLKRTLPKNDARMLQSIASATAILVPQCPVTRMREAFARMLAPALEGRQRIALTPCYDLLIRQGSDFAAR